MPGASAEWYRREITINNGGSTTLTDYQVLVTLSIHSHYDHMDSNGDSIRFTNIANDQKYDYWIEDWVYDGTSRIWVEVPSVTIGNSNMYLWSKESGDSAENSGDATFPFFDGFNNLDSWEKETFYSGFDDHATISAVGGNLRVVSTGDNRAGPTTKAPQLSQGQTFEAKMVTRTGDAETNQLLYLSKDNWYENDCYTTLPIDNVYSVWRAHEGIADERWNGGEGSGDNVTSYPYIEYRTTDYVHFGTRDKGQVYTENSV